MIAGTAMRCKEPTAISKLFVCGMLAPPTWEKKTSTVAMTLPTSKQNCFGAQTKVNTTSNSKCFFAVDLHSVLQEGLVPIRIGNTTVWCISRLASGRNNQHHKSVGFLNKTKRLWLQVSMKCPRFQTDPKKRATCLSPTALCLHLGSQQGRQQQVASKPPACLWPSLKASPCKRQVSS